MNLKENQVNQVKYSYKTTERSEYCIYGEKITKPLGALDDGWEWGDNNFFFQGGGIFIGTFLQNSYKPSQKLCERRTISVQLL